MQNFEMSLSEAATALAAGKTTSEELTTECLDRAQIWQASRNCFIEIDADAALSQARERDRERRNGRARSRLHGIPLAHKDMFYRAGAISTGGSKIRRDWRADRTATVLSRLDDAGSIEIGRLNMSEFAAYATGENIHYGHCHNAFAHGRIAGGSSSGSGAAVAARLIFGSLGSDTGGSIRMPASMNGVVGIKPTYGRVSRYGALPRSWSLDHIGPLARTAVDCGLMLGAIAGYDANDGACSHADVPDYLSHADEDLSNLRIGYFDPDQLKLDDDVATAFRSTLHECEQLHLRIKSIAPPDFAPIFSAAEIIIKAEAASLHYQWLRDRPADYFPPIRNRIAAGFFIPAIHYIDALRLRPVIAQEFRQSIFGEIDVLLLPSMPVSVPTFADVDVSVSRANMLQMLSRLTAFTRPFSFLGFPALSFPGGFCRNGLPIGMQLVGLPFQEALLIGVAHQVLQRTRHNAVVPTL
jgi:aspartyl-tRNA(Asn)/glutamyl-tRNA(Gln) amidotransferase subunit A